MTIETEEDIARGVRSLRRRCAVLREVYKVTGHPPLRRREPGLAGLVRIIVGQQVSVASANAIWERCAEAIVPMNAARIAALSDDELRGCGLSRPKIRTLRAVATAISDNALNLEGAAGILEEEMRNSLLNVTGIGPWTADVFQLFCLGQQDAFAPGDLALQVAAQHAFGLDDRPTPEELIELARPWRPWRGVAARLLWAYYAAIKDGRSGIEV
jgi:DNA-3-methyladenine glycosylase II